MSNLHGDDDHWSALGQPWRVALSLAWEAHIAGNIGIGAALTDQTGTIVAQGRNRVCDRRAPPGRLRSTFLAHAEVDVLGQLSPGDYSQHTLWTTLEPCLLCSAAIVMGNVGIVCYAGRDRLWDGMSRLADLNDFVASRWPSRHGPLQGPISVFCELLPLFWFLQNRQDGRVVRQCRTDHPKLLGLAERLATDGRLADLKSQPVDLAIDRIWDDLSEVGTPDSALAR